MNTDAQALSSAAVPPENRLQIGRELTRGLGAGGNPDIGQAAARESQAEIARLVDGDFALGVARAARERARRSR